MKEYGLDDVGGTLVLTVKEDGVAKDISSASAIKYVVLKPDQTIVELTAAFVTDGTNGQVTYTWVADDLDQVGQYEVQVKLTGSPWSGQSDSYVFEVRETFVA